MSEQKQYKNLETLVSRYIKLNMSEEEETVSDNFDLCMGTKSIRNKRRKIENADSSNKSSENLSHIRLTGAIAQYLLSRVPLPTSRVDLQKKFIKPEGSKKVDLDSILNLINDKFKSCLGLGIFGLDKSITNQTSSNPKYYVVQLNRSKAHLDLVYQFGNINFKSIGELTVDQDETNLVSNRLCNSFLTFLSFLFGFFEITSSDEDLIQNDDDSSKVIQNNEEIEIPIELINEFTGVIFNSEKILFELNTLFGSKSTNSKQTNEEEDSLITVNSKLSKISIIFYILYKAGYLIPTFSTQTTNGNHIVSGFKNGPILKWDSEHIKKIVHLNS
ncbi:uncharacterized protein cubi_00065 [Cryptosporidium ubiquitum]|uniref:Uncharacterized protein n=1 Tax=Cryptosporidium ubiquitum TaxID=857276 RepID=A0A1J4MJV8_9CRYT|nr:uncharacterized protein cubi_00065 [Cryptosporidium ubiquitum]OII74512.1 hypothetical protein cubi_00065 [Cryptosporidium ubiquitum]